MLRGFSNELSRILRPDQIVKNPDQLALFQYDKSPLVGMCPVAVLEPDSHSQVVDILDWANRERIPLVTRGAGTGTTGACLPATPDTVVLSTKRLNKIIQIEALNRCVVVQPGVITSEINAKAIEMGLFYPPDPASLDSCSIGGNLALNAGGPRAMKYGVTRDYVLGLKGVWGNGEAFELGGKRHKDVAGYDLIRLLIGSEGTLGVITEATLKLVSYLPYRALVLAGFCNIHHAVEVLAHIQKSGIQPVCAELIDPLCYRSVTDFLNMDMLLPAFEVAILFELEAHSQLVLVDQLNQLTSHIQRTTPEFVQVAETDSEMASLWAIRRHISHALRSMSPDKCSDDVVVPLCEIPNLMTFIQSLNSPLVQVLGFGHLGDGNIHVNMLRKSATESEWVELKARLREQLFKAVVEMGGSITAEHGVGRSKKAFLPLMFSSEIQDKFQKIKSIFDPNTILNPGLI